MGAHRLEMSLYKISSLINIKKNLGVVKYFLKRQQNHKQCIARLHSSAPELHCATLKGRIKSGSLITIRALALLNRSGYTSRRAV